MIILRAEIGEAGYGHKVVLREVCLEAHAGRIVAIIGSNGSGKSTLLKAIIGIVKIGCGVVSFNGREITNDPPEHNVMAGISFVPQGNGVFDGLTVRENLEIGAHCLKDAEVKKERFESVLLQFPDLRARLRQVATKLSGGEKQQLSIARGLMLRPKVLLLDEPSLGLSPRAVGRLFDSIRNINEVHDMTIVLVEQKVREALKLANDVYALRMGEIIYSGPPSALGPLDLRRIFLV